MTSLPRRLLTSGLDAVLTFVWVVWPLVPATWLLGLGLQRLAFTPDGLSRWSLVTWCAVAPLLYAAWLILTLAVSAIDIQIHVAYLRYDKPKRATNRGTIHEWFMLYASCFSYVRLKAITSLPLAESFIMSPVLRHLVFLAYCRKTSLGARSLIIGTLYDPDLTEIGEDAIIGTATSVVAHNVTTKPDGTMVMATSPIRIGPRVVIGGDCRIDMGVRIGADAMVEPMSYVTAFTDIGDGEIWGGSPARFLRHRFDQETTPSRPAIPAELPPAAAATKTGLSDSSEQTLREIVAAALHRPVGSITPDLSARDCVGWDSLAQLGMAADLQKRFGLVLNQQESFRLRSLEDLRALVRRTLKTVPS